MSDPDPIEAQAVVLTALASAPAPLPALARALADQLTVPQGWAPPEGWGPYAARVVDALAAAGQVAGPATSAWLYRLAG